MRVHVRAFTYVEIYGGYVNCSDRNCSDRKLRTKPMGLKFSSRDTCFHHLLHAKQFCLPSPINCNYCSFQCYSTSLPFCPCVNLCPEKIKLFGVILEIPSLCQGSSVVLGLGTPITRIASRS